MRLATLAFALCLAPAPAVAQPATPYPSICGHTLRLGADNVLTGLRGAPVTLAQGTASLQSVTLRGGAAVIARVAREGTPVEAAVIVCAGTAAPSLVWRGSTAWRGEDIGDRTRDSVAVRSRAGVSEISIVRVRESPRLCGVDAWPAESARVDAISGAVSPMEPADPLEAEGVASPTSVAATAATPAPRGFTPRSVAVSAGEARSLFDRDARSSWTPGAHGFVTVTLPSAAFELRGLDLAASSAPLARRWTLLVGRARGLARYDFELPSTTLTREQVWRVALPSPVTARCVSLVARGAAAGEALGDVALRSALDDGAASLVALARAVDGADGDASASMLVELGSAGVDALAAALPDLSTVGARRAIRALSTVPSNASATALSRALTRDDTEEAAADALRHMGAPALGALSTVVSTAPRAARVIEAIAAPIDARLRASLPALSAERDVWIAARPALTSLLAECSAARGGEAWIAMIPAEALAASRALRLTSEVFAIDDPTRRLAAERALSLWRADAGFETRYRLLAALAANDEGRAILTEVLSHDADHDLRAAAALALAPVSTATGALRTATNDRVPRVRAAAIEALRGRDGARESIVHSLSNDAWPSVRAAAAEALARDPEAAPALLDALDAGSTVTVRAVIVALGENPGEGITPRLAAFLQGSRRSPELRREAAEALGRRCDRAAATTLERVAEELSDPALPPWEQAVGHAALASLARLDAARARAFLTRSEANSEAAAAVARAARQGCR